MELQLVSSGLPSTVIGSSNRRLVSHQFVSARLVIYGGRRVRPEISLKSHIIQRSFKDLCQPRLRRRAILCTFESNSHFNPEAELESYGRKDSSVSYSVTGGVEPFRGKSGSVSFTGITHQLVEEGKLISAPFYEDKGSFLWLLAPAALLSSLIIPQFVFGSAVEEFLKNEILVEVLNSLISEVGFYVGLATFLGVTDQVQRPYLQFSSKRWSLITGLRGYMASAFFTSGFKVIAPLFAICVTLPAIGLAALVAVAPFLVSSLAQFLFEAHLSKRGSSCWPLVPIIFELYRLYQLAKAANFMERLMLGMKDLRTTPQAVEKAGAVLSMIVFFQVLGVVCLWSLITFLIRLFPSRPVAENY